MMRLRTLELQGYKSFATKTVFQFDEGITAIVGPNGTGKSNVSDGVRWVLGEQSYSALRGKKTEDMIFSGTDGRARLGMACVTLVFDNSDGWLPVDFSEVTITRRAYRDGQNEYLLNGSRVRLRDINELLAASGLSRRTYTHVGQGLVDAALSLRAEERRALFEEAAGITLHNSRRSDVLNKLDATQANLLRLHDIVSEIEPRLRYLSRQAERTEKHRIISSHLESLLRTWYGYRWSLGQKFLRQVRERNNQSQQALDAQIGRLESVDRQIIEMRARRSELRMQLGEWHRQGSGLHDEAEAIQRGLAVGEERARLLTAQREELLGEAESIRTDLQAVQSLVDESQALLTQLEPDLAAVRYRVEVLSTQLKAHQEERRAAEKKQAQAEEQVRTLADSIAGNRARVAQLVERQDQLEQEIAECRDAVTAHHQAQATAAEHLAEKSRLLQQVTADMAATETERVAHLSARQELEKEATQLGDRVNTHRQQMEALNARHDLLSKMQRDLVGYHEGTRSVLKAARKLSQLSGIVGIANELLEVPPDLETAVETALGNHMQDIVVNTWADAEAAIAYLKKTHGGRATFLPLDTIRPPSRLEPPSTSKVLGIGSDLVTCEKRLIPVARLLLGRTVITEDLPAARGALRAAQGGFQVVTRAGDLVRAGGSVSGGSTGRGKASSGLLARQRELQALPSALAEKETALRALEAQIADNKRAHEEHQSALEGIARHHQMLQANRTTSEREQAALTRDAERAEQAAHWQQELLDRTQTQRAELDQNGKQLLAEIERLETEQTRAQPHAQDLASQAAALSAESLLTHLSQARTELAVIEGRHNSQRAILEGHQNSHSEILTRVQAKEHRAEELSREEEGLLVRLNDQRHRSTELNELITALTGLIEPAEAELDALEHRQAEAETEGNQQRQTLQRLEAEHNGTTLEMSRCQDEMAMLHRQILADLGLVDVDLNQDQVGQPLLPLHPLISQLPAVTELPENLEQDIQQIRVQLGQLGSVNLHASEEHEEMRSRHEYLTQQMADLEKATADLRQIITELDQLMEQGFSVTFEAVAREFKAYFKQLFNGGDAELVLTDPENLTETGIDIIARPPGKRSQSLNMLSGGERALTAAALIFSLLSTSPTPYCVLDEVDAMLDEANVSRFRDALTGLAQRIQFVVITHNRRTVEAANTIYGVSMGDDSVSRVISLKLDEPSDASGSQDE